MTQSKLSVVSQAKHIVSSTMYPVTPAKAKQWLEKSMWGKQREYRPWHAEILAEAMRRGHFTEGVQIHFAKLNGEIQLINGQHTLNAIVLSKIDTTLTILTTVVSSEREIADLYSRHDIGLQRTFNDASEAHSLRAEYNLSAYQITSIAGGIRTINDQFMNVKKTAKSYETNSVSEQIAAFSKYGNPGKQFFEAISGAPRVVSVAMRTRGVMGIALLTFLESPDTAKRFWAQTAIGDGLEVGDPRKTLLDWLLDNPFKGASTMPLRARTVAKAWNAFVNGVSIKRITRIDPTAPIALLKAA